MKIIIWKSILATLVAILLLCGVAAAACVCFFPPTVMEISYNLGLDRTAMRYAEKSYQRFRESYYAAFAMEIAVSEGLNEETEKYAEALLRCEDFEDFCKISSADGDKTINENLGSYEQYTYATLCVAKYRLGKGEEAVNVAAESLNGTFPANNSLAAVLLNALKDGNESVAAMATEKLSAVDESKLSEEERAYYYAIKTLATGRS